MPPVTVPSSAWRTAPWESRRSWDVLCRQESAERGQIVQSQRPQQSVLLPVFTGRYKHRMEGDCLIPSPPRQQPQLLRPKQGSRAAHGRLLSPLGQRAHKSNDSVHSTHAHPAAPRSPIHSQDSPSLAARLCHCAAARPAAPLHPRGGTISVTKPASIWQWEALL